MNALIPGTPKGNGPALEPVRFERTQPAASSVCIAGTFNGWHPQATPMIPWGDGRWLKELVLAPGSYEYCLVVDGKWMADSLTQETVLEPVWQTELSFERGPLRIKGPQPGPDANHQ